MYTILSFPFFLLSYPFSHFNVFTFFPAAPAVHWTESLFLCVDGCYAKSVKATLKNK